MDFNKITEYLDSLTNQGIPGVDCIICQNHEILYRHMAGTTDKNYTRAINGDESYLMFSMTKVTTMTAFMQLVEKGLISLDDEVSKYIPAYANLKYEKDGVIHDADPMKLWHLVSMQSGLDYDLNRPGILRVLKERGAQATTRELVEAFVESPLKFNPGEHFLYSLSHDVIAAIIEIVSGMKYSEYLKKNIWEPLGMTKTFFAAPVNDGVPGLAQQFIVDEQGKTVPMEQTCNYQLSESYESGGAGLISCTGDYSLLADAIACGGIGRSGNRILKPESIELIKHNLLSDEGRRDIELGMGRAGYGYGIGMQVLMEPDKINSPSPAGVFGWDGAAGSCITMDTASGISIVYIQHVRNCGFSYAQIHPTLRDFVFGK